MSALSEKADFAEPGSAKSAFSEAA